MSHRRDRQKVIRLKTHTFPSNTSIPFSCDDRIQRRACNGQKSGQEPEVPVVKAVCPAEPCNRFPLEHGSIVQDDYIHYPIRKLGLEEKSFFSGIGLQKKTAASQITGQRFKNILSLSHKSRNAIHSPGVMPFSCRMVYSAVRLSDHTIPDLKSYVMKSERSMCRRILWPDEKFRKRVAEIGIIPSSDVELSDPNWVMKRKRLAEIEKKRRLKQEFEQQEAEEKRRKTLRDLRSYPTKELLSILPQISQDYAVEVERAEPRDCPSCGKTVYAVDGRVWHNCPNIA